MIFSSLNYGSHCRISKCPLKVEQSSFWQSISPTWAALSSRRVIHVFRLNLETHNLIWEPLNLWTPTTQNKRQTAWTVSLHANFSSAHMKLKRTYLTCQQHMYVHASSSAALASLMKGRCSSQQTCSMSCHCLRNHIRDEEMQHTPLQQSCSHARCACANRRDSQFHKIIVVHSLQLVQLTPYECFNTRRVVK